MKKLFKLFAVAAVIICSGFATAHAQQMPPLPIDPNVRIGKLDNGLTYYIRKNNIPENRADFYIAQKVGSILEEKSQSGLAHFLEHMCFNGTTHFPGDALKQYLESIGVKFGVNLNAYTSVDETVYNISNVPVKTEGATDQCLTILHDWSNDLLLEPEEIDKERGVIHEEWRSRMSPMQRMQEKMLPQLFAGTKYEDCFPIGSMDVVMNFKYQTLRDYYEKWYRPDLQGIVVVGDIDVDEIESKIKTIFADIPAQPDAAERVYFQVNDNDEPIIAIEKDKEQPVTQAMLFYKHDVTPDAAKGSIPYMIEGYALNMINTMLNNRLGELTQQANPPFIYAATYDGNFFVSKTKGAFTGVVACREEAINDGIVTLMREIERAKRFGFTDSEYARARAEYLSQMESAFNERDKRQNEEYVQEYVRHFLDNEPIPGIENEYAIMSQIAPNVPVEALNELMSNLITDKNRVVAIMASEKEGVQLPTKEDVLNMIENSKKEELTAYVDKVSNEPLMAERPQGGKIVSEKHNAQFDATELTLANGVKVILKPTEYKADEILMKGVSLGGSSLFPNEEILNIESLDLVGIGGLGNFNAIDLQKVLAGKQANVTYGIGDKTEAVRGSCAPKDLETMLQLTYLTFTAPRLDEEALASYKSRAKASLKNMEVNPAVEYGDSLNATLYNHHPRVIRVKADMIDKIDDQKVMEMYKDRFADASDFTFIMVGNINVDQDKQLIADYLGNLPSINRKETFKDNKKYIREGIHTLEFEKEQETPKADVFVMYSGKCKYNQKNNLIMSMFCQIMDLIYTETVRENEGGTYGVSVVGDIAKYPKELAIVQIMFQTAPEKKEKLMQIIFREMGNMALIAPKESDLNKVKEYMLKKHNEDMKQNGFWLGRIDNALFTGVDMQKDYEEAVKSITPKDIQKFAKALLKQNNRIEVSMISKKK